MTEEKKEDIVSSEKVESKGDVAPSVEGVSDGDGIAIASAKREEDRKNGVKSVPKFTMPKIFIKEDELVDVDVEIVFNPDNGEIFTICRKGILNRGIIQELSIVDYNFKFSPINYRQLQSYKKAASIFDKSSGEVVLNRLQMRSYILINHLKETDMPDENGERLELKIDKIHNNLEMESLEKLNRTFPSLMEIVLSLFEKKMLINFDNDAE